MPFTFSHPAIILPFRNVGSVTALVIGSMVPDFPSFITLDLDKKFSHSLKGAILLDLPLALLLCYIFHLLVRKTLINHLPGYFKSRFNRFYFFDWEAHVKAKPFNVLFSLIAGIASHLLWDQLTHPGSVIPDMEKRVHILGLSEPLFVFIQYACSLPALLFIFVVIHRLPASNTVTQSSNKAIYWMLVAAVSIMVIIYGFVNYSNNKYYTTIFINTSIAGLLAGLITSSVIHTLFISKAKSTASTALLDR